MDLSSDQTERKCTAQTAKKTSLTFNKKVPNHMRKCPHVFEDCRQIPIFQNLYSEPRRTAINACAFISLQKFYPNKMSASRSDFTYIRIHSSLHKYIAYPNIGSYIIIFKLLGDSVLGYLLLNYKYSITMY